MSNFKQVNAKEYADALYQKGVDVITAHKEASVLAELLTEARVIDTYTADGNRESSELRQAGTILVTAATRDGQPKIDSFGHTNTWPLDPDEFARCFKTEGVDLSKPFHGLFESQSETRRFIQIPNDISIQTSWGTQNLKAGAYLNISDPNKKNYSGVGEFEFQDNYVVEKIQNSLEEQKELLIHDEQNIEPAPEVEKPLQSMLGQTQSDKEWLETLIKAGMDTKEAEALVKKAREEKNHENVQKNDGPSLGGD